MATEVARHRPSSKHGRGFDSRRLHQPWFLAEDHARIVRAQLVGNPPGQGFGETPARLLQLEQLQVAHLCNALEVVVRTEQAAVVPNGGRRNLAIDG